MAHEAHRRGGTAVLAWGICFATLGVVAAATTLVVLNLTSIHDTDQANLIALVLPVGFAILGGLVGSRQPENRLAWLFLAIAFCTALHGLTDQYTLFALVTQPGVPFSVWITWIGSLTDTLVYPGGLALLAFLTLPSGHLLSPRWRLVAWAGAATTLTYEILLILDPTQLNATGRPPLMNPTGVAGWEGISNLGAPGTVAFLLGLGTLAVAVASLLIRLRRAQGEERIQLRWVTYAGAFAIVINVASVVIGLILLDNRTTVIVSSITGILGFGVALPAAFAVAILRYRLYDLDLLLNRTILYGVVSVVLAAGFIGANVLAQRAAEAIVGQRSELVAAGLGIAVAVAWGPMRRTVRPLVDRALPARSRLTLLFTDIVESTRHLVDLGDEQWREVLDRYRALVRSALAHHRGREVNTAGDGFFAVFDHARRAVECATEMRAAVAELGLRVRTGLHVDEVEMRGEQVSGLAVHAAARVMAEAGADEILLSAAVADELGESVALSDAGTHALRGVPGEWQLYAVP
jgi:class 3 adenylate cyclase